MSIYVVLVCFLLSTVYCLENDTFSVLDKLKSGLKLAGQYLISDHANGVASLVSEALEKSRPHPETNDTVTSSNIFSGILRILGFDSKKIGAITVNAIIFIAQLISSSISLKPPSKITQARKSENPESLFDWVVHNEGVADIMPDMENKDLPKKIIEYVQERSLDEDTGCVQLLICKSAPFIRHMQRSLSERGNSSTRGYKALFAYLPSLEEFSENGDRCEKRHPYCYIPL